MLSKDCFDIEERLKPMMVQALETQSFGIQIKVYGVVRSMIPSAGGPVPAWGLYYQAAGRLIGTDHYVAQMTLITNPYASQQDIDNAFAEGCGSLREQINSQGIIQNGGSK